MEEDDPYESIIDPLGLGDETFGPIPDEYTQQKGNAYRDGRNPYRMSGTGNKGYQDGGYIPLGGFVKQALRNVYGN